MVRAAAVMLLLGRAAAMYGPNSHVLQADEKSFKETVLKGDGISIVEFYAPWCGHCKSLAPEWDKAATLLKGVANVVAVDATVHGSLAQKYGVQGYPTIKVFGLGKAPTDYQGQRNADGIVAEAMSAVRTLVSQRQKGKAKPKGKKEAGAGGAGAGAGGEKPKGGKRVSDVIDLTSDSFNEVLTSSDPYIVEFYAPWCGHCKQLEPEFKAAAAELKDFGVKLAAVDATAHADLAAQYGVKGYPTIFVFRGTGANRSRPEPYNGARDADGITAFGMTLVDFSLKQLTDPSNITQRCSGKKICVLAFLPHIMDSGKAGREGYMEVLANAAKVVKPTVFSFMWSEGGAQEKLEEAMGLTFGYPVVVAYSAEKKAFAMHVGSFKSDAIGAFLTGITTGGTKTSKLDSLPPVVAVAAWDGKDAAAPVDEIPLDELFADEL